MRQTRAYSLNNSVENLGTFGVRLRCLKELFFPGTFSFRNFLKSLEESWIHEPYLILGLQPGLEKKVYYSATTKGLLRAATLSLI